MEILNTLDSQVSPISLPNGNCSNGTIVERMSSFLTCFGRNRMAEINASDILRLGMFAQRTERQLADLAAVTIGELHCLTQLHIEKPCCIRRLSSILGVSASSTSKLLRSLDEKGYIERELDATDRRQERVHLTEEGAAVVQRIMTAGDAIAASLIESLPPERRAPFSDCVRTIITSTVVSPLNITSKEEV